MIQTCPNYLFFFNFYISKWSYPRDYCLVIWQLKSSYCLFVLIVVVVVIIIIIVVVCFFSRWKIFILCFPFSYCVLFFPVELFEVFDKSPQLWCEDGLAEAVLATYTWCFMQFTLVFTATAQTVPDEKKVFNMWLLSYVLISYWAIFKKEEGCKGARGQGRKERNWGREGGKRGGRERGRERGAGGEKEGIQKGGTERIKTREQGRIDMTSEKKNKQTNKKEWE